MNDITELTNAALLEEFARKCYDEGFKKQSYQDMRTVMLLEELLNRLENK